MKTVKILLVATLSLPLFSLAQDSLHHGHTQAPTAVKTLPEVTIRMDDNMRFTPQSIHVKQGETLRLKVINDGKIPHELVLGPKHELLAHAKEMRSGTGHGHHSNNAITLNAGEQGEIIWVFKKAGILDFACLIPGHFEAGMSGEVRVK